MKDFIKTTVLGALLATAGSAAFAETELRLSVETPPGHVRNLAAERWAEAIAEASGGVSQQLAGARAMRVERRVPGGFALSRIQAHLQPVRGLVTGHIFRPFDQADRVIEGLFDAELIDFL